MPWTKDEMRSMGGERVVITGANSGIGFHAARGFAESGADVTMACRSLDRGEEAAEEVREAAGSGASVEVRELDLASLASVEDFADGYRDDHGALDVLCNNAGVMAIPRRETEDGFEQQLGVNHLGHFALTARLVDLVADADGRVVATSSGAHESGGVDFDDLQSEESYGKWGAYAQSKLANLLFAFELQRRFDAAETDAISVGVHPGYAATNLQRRGPEMEGSRLKLAFMKAVNAVLAQSAERGALPILYGATANLEGGEYVGPGGFMSMRGYPEVQEPNGSARDEETARRLWEVSEELTGVEFDV